MGQPYHKPTRAEGAERVGVTFDLLDRRLRKSEVKRALKARYGVSARTCERYLARARASARALSGVSLHEHRLMSFAFWESVIRHPQATVRQRVRARRQLDRLLGLYQAAGVVLLPGERVESGLPG